MIYTLFISLPLKWHLKVKFWWLIFCLSFNPINLGLTVTFLQTGVVSFSGCAILQYERVRSYYSSQQSSFNGFMNFKLFRFRQQVNWDSLCLLQKPCTTVFLYLLTQICFPIGGECVRCHGSKLINSLGKNDLNFWHGGQVVHVQNCGKFVCQPREANTFYTVIAAKWSQTRTKEEVEQLLHNRSSKSTNEV